MRISFASLALILSAWSVVSLNHLNRDTRLSSVKSEIAVGNNGSGSGAHALTVSNSAGSVPTADLPWPRTSGDSCSCGCYSVLSGAFWSCAAGAGPCCQNDAPPPGPAPVNARLYPKGSVQVPTSIVAADQVGTAQGVTFRTNGKNHKPCPPLPPLGNTTIVIAPERTVVLLTRLTREIKPDAVPGLQALLPRAGSPVVAIPELRAKIRRCVLSNRIHQG
jgi:hypothetical protein